MCKYRISRKYLKHKQRGKLGWRVLVSDLGDLGSISHSSTDFLYDVGGSLTLSEPVHL